MAHARKVSTGTIAPAVFVPDGEPPLPRFKRRLSGNFATWWARSKSNDPALLRNEKLLIADIARAVSGMLTVPLEQATPETMKQATNQLDFLGINMGIDHLEFPRHTSLTALPKMIDSPLRKFFGNGTDLDDLAGIESFQRLEEVISVDGHLRDLTALASIAGIRRLDLTVNAITDLTPLAALTGLVWLRLDRNTIEDLTPLQGLTKLEVLTITGNQVASLAPLAGLPSLKVLALNANAGGPPSEVIENPLLDVRALAQIPHLANPFAAAAKLRLTVLNQEGALVRAGVAGRVGDSNRFEFVSDADGSSEKIQIQGLAEWKDLNVFTAPVVATAIRFANGEVGIACTRPDDRTAFLPAGDLVGLFPNTIPFGRTFPEFFVVGGVHDSTSPQLFLSVQPQ
jgi:hypothetical protein